MRATTPTLLTALCLLSLSNVFGQINVSQSNGCAPMSVTFSTELIGSQYQWSFSDGSSSQAATPTLTFTTPGTYAVTLTLNSTTYTLANAVTVNPVPTPQIAVDTTHVCAQQPVSFSSTAASTSTVLWDFGNGTSSTQHTPTFTYASGGAYTVTLQETSAFGCVGTTVAVNLMTIQALPSAAFTLSSGSLCEGDAQVFQCAQAALPSYQWTVNGSAASTGQSANLSLSAGTYTVALSCTSTFGCNASTTQNIAVTAPQLPVVNVNAASGCVPFEPGISISSSGFTNISWAMGSHVSTGTNPAFNFQSPACGWLCYLATDPNGCLVSDTVAQINAFPSPHAQFTISDTSFCDSASLTAQSVTSAENHLFVIGTDSFQNNSVSWSSHQIGHYDVLYVATLANGCSDTAFHPAMVKLESGMPLFEPTARAGCSHLDVAVQIENTYLANYLWTSSAGDSVSDDQGSFGFDSLGSYSISFAGMSHIGCSASLSFPNIAHIYAATPPAIDPVTLEFCTFANASISAENTGLTPVQWNLGDGSLSNDSIATHLYNAPGTYVVGLTGTNAQGCLVTIDSHTIVEVTTLNPTAIVEVLDCGDRTVLFQATDSASSSHWYINGGDYYQNPLTLTMPSNGPFDVELTVSNGRCSRTATYVNLLDFNDCSFGGSGSGNASSGAGGYAGGTAQEPRMTSCSSSLVYFTSPFDSTHTTYWNFGDGDTAIGVFPSHQYQNAGTFDLTITGVNILGDSTFISAPYFIRIGNPIADFEATPHRMCAGASVRVLNNSSFATAYTFDFGDSTISNDPQPSHFYGAAGLKVIWLVAEDSLGCIASTTRTVFTGDTIAWMDTDSLLCLGDSLHITHNVNYFDTYTWTFGGATFTGKNPAIATTDTGHVSLSLAVTDTSGCVSHYFQDQSVYVAAPTAQFSLPTASIACDGFSGAITNLSVGSDKYRWYVNNTFFSVAPHPYLQVQDTGDYLYRLQASRHGCRSEHTADTVHLYRAVADFSVSVASMCLPTSATFTDLSTNAQSWTWDFGNGQTSGLANANTNYTTPISAPITLDIIDEHGCAGHSEQAPPNFLNVQIQSSITEGCAPLAVTFSDNIGVASQYLWQFDDGQSSSAAAPSVVFSSTGYHHVSVTAVHESGCSATFTEDSIVHAFKPTAHFVIDSMGSGCAPRYVRFQDQSADAVYAWWGFGDLSFGNGLGPTHFYTNAGSYDVIHVAIDAMGCTDTSYSLTPIEVSGPTANFDIPDAHCAFDTVHFQNTSLDAHSYVWYFGDGSGSTDVHPVHRYTVPGQMQLTLIAQDSAGCSHTKVVPGYFVKETPVIDVVANVDQECIPVNLSFEARVQFGVEPIFQWYIGDSLIVADEHLQAVWTKAGRYDVRLKVENSNACLSSDTVQSAFIAYDTLSTTTSILQSLNLTESGAQVHYNIARTDNFESYELFGYDVPGNSWRMLASGSSNSIAFTDSDQSGLEQPACFKVAMKSHCVAEKPLALIDPQCSIHLQAQKKNGVPRLKWNKVDERQDAPFEVYRRANGADEFELVRSMPADSTVMWDNSPLCPGAVEYYIRTNYSTTSQASVQSRQRTVNADSLASLGEQVKISYVTVLEQDRVLIEWREPSLDRSLIESLWLIRTDEDGTVTTQIDPRAGSFVDDDARPSEGSQTYHIEVQSICPTDRVAGPASSTIFLQSAQDGYRVRLNWTEYEGWEAVKAYEIQIQDEYGQWQTMEVVPGSRVETEINLMEVD